MLGPIKFSTIFISTCTKSGKENQKRLRPILYV